jgi:hypothetical protein
MATTIPQSGRLVALDQIRVPENVRALDDAHVAALAGSIALQGMLVPLVVRTDDDGDNGFELVAGFHRVAAARSLGLAEVQVVVRDADTEAADRAAENITSCRRRHDVINADPAVMPTPVRAARGSLRTRGAGRHKRASIGPSVRLQAAAGAVTCQLLLSGAKQVREKHPAMRSRFVHSGRLRPAGGDHRSRD